ncbi:unnamed protein product [Musa acuminata var. zebrina]
MTEESQATSDHVEAEPSSEVDLLVDRDGKHILTCGESDLLQKEGNRYVEEEASLDGEFSKFEESIYAKESSHLFKQISEVEEASSVEDLKTRNRVANVNLLVMEKKKELELQLEESGRGQELSESEKSLPKSEFHLANQKLVNMNRYCEEHELNQKAMKDDILEALTSNDTKHKKLLEVKEAFTGLADELKSSRKKMKELQEGLVSSANEMCKLEEFSKHSSSQAELESKRALQFGNMLELAQFKAKEIEGQMDNLQKGLKGLYERIAENQHVKGVLHANAVELSTIQEKLEISRSTVADFEQKLVSKDSIIHELTQELNIHKASEERMKTHVLELENLLAASKEELETKHANLEEIELKLQEKIGASFKNQVLWQKVTLQSLQKDLSDLTREKVTLQSTVADLSMKLSMNEEQCQQLEANLNLADQNFNKTDSLLSQALLRNKELEQNQRSFEELHHDMKKVMDATTKRNLELENLVQASKLAEESLKTKLRQSEMRSFSAEKRNMELKQQFNTTEMRCLEAESEIEDLNNQVKELTTLLRKIDEENSLSRRRFQGYENKIGQLESSLSKSFRRNTELEKELNCLLEKCVEHEGQATAAHQSNAELEDKVQTSHSKTEIEKCVKHKGQGTTEHQSNVELGDKVQSSHFETENAVTGADELEQLLETANYRIQELEQILATMEAKYRDTETELKQYSSKVSALFAEIEAYQARSESLESVLQAANEKESELTDALDATIKDRKKLEDLSNIQAKSLSEAENLIQILQNKLKSLGAKLESAEEQLQASSLREKELVEKLRSTGDQLKHDGKAVEDINTRNLEMNSLNESLDKDTGFKFKETTLRFNQKESEFKELHEKLKFLEEQKTLYKDHALESNEEVASLKAELEANAMKLVSLDNKVEEFNQKVLESDLRAEQISLENELMAVTNSKLRLELAACQLQLNQLNQLLNTNHAEMEATSEQLASHVKTISKLTDENSTYLELQSATEYRLRETEVQLHETIEKFKQKDSEVRDLIEKLLALETQLRSHDEQASELAAIASSRKDKLEDTLLKLQNLEAFVEHLKRSSEISKLENEDLMGENLTMSQELAAYKTKINELKIVFNAVVAEKQVTSIQLHDSRKEMKVLMQQINSDKEKHQLQITAAKEEYNKVTESYQKTKKDLEAIIIQLEEQLSEQKTKEISLCADMKILKAELADKSLMQEQISELESKLLFAQKSYMEEIEGMRSTVVEKDVILIPKLEEHTCIIEERDTLIQQLKKVQSDLDIAHRTIKEQFQNKTAEGELQNEIEAKSRDLGLGTSITMYGRNIKENDNHMNQALETKSLNLATQIDEEASGAMAFKFILGVALVSMFIGIILGKRIAVWDSSVVGSARNSFPSETSTFPCAVQGTT